MSQSMPQSQTIRATWKTRAIKIFLPNVFVYQSHLISWHSAYTTRKTLPNGDLCITVGQLRNDRKRKRSSRIIRNILLINARSKMMIRVLKPVCTLRGQSVTFMQLMPVTIKTASSISLLKENPRSQVVLPLYKIHVVMIHGFATLYKCC